MMGLFTAGFHLRVLGSHPGTLFRDVIHYLEILSASIIVHLFTESLDLLTCYIDLISSLLM